MTERKANTSVAARDLATVKDNELVNQLLSAFPGAVVRDSVDYTGGEVVEKETLVDVPFVVLDWRVSNSDAYERVVDGVIVSSEFIIVQVGTADGSRLLFTDGGVGIRPVLEQFTSDTNSRAGLLCRRGLRVSKYSKKMEDGTSRDATTYYLS